MRFVEDLKYMDKDNMSKYLYRFSVRADLIYDIESNSEEEARKFLVKEGGLSITRDDILVEESDYEDAELVEERKLP